MGRVCAPSFDSVRLCNDKLVIRVCGRPSFTANASVANDVPALFACGEVNGDSLVGLLLLLKLLLVCKSDESLLCIPTNSDESLLCMPANVDIVVNELSLLCDAIVLSDDTDVFWLGTREGTVGTPGTNTDDGA